jgi:hypothetical protein
VFVKCIASNEFIVSSECLRDNCGLTR